jgi:hypothetical protein
MNNKEGLFYPTISETKFTEKYEYTFHYIISAVKKIKENDRRKKNRINVEKKEG